MSGKDIVLDINQIKEMIPHRYPFLMIDRVYDIEIGKSCKAIKNVSVNEWYFSGHFPNKPIMPGVLMVEGMAQAAGVLAYYSIKQEEQQAHQQSEMYFMTIDNVKFRAIVQPSDTLVMCINVTQQRGNIWKFSGEASVNGKPVCEASFMAMMPNKQ